MLIPTIQLRAGQVIGCDKEGQEVALKHDPVGLAKALYRYGEIAVIDLDAAQGEGDNLDLIREICRVTECRVGGGIKDETRADAILRAGARRIIVGSAADEDLLARFPRKKVLVGMDIQQGRVVRNGWKQATNIDPLDLALRLRGFCAGFVYSLVGHRSNMEQTEVERFEALRAHLPDHSLTTSGGVLTAEDVRELDRLGVDVQIVHGHTPARLDVGDAFLAVVDFEKRGGLLPVIVQDTADQVLALRDANRDALLASLRSGKATYWSRVRGRLWTKGESAGIPDEVLTVRVSANRDALLFTVKPAGVDPRGRYSTFDEISYNLHRIEQVLKSRQNKGDSRKSYSTLMLADRQGVKKRIREEAEALATADGRDEILWETADLIYFVLLHLVLEGVSLDEVVKELRGRAGRRRS